MILTLLIVVGLMSYSAVVGYVYPTALANSVARCRRCGTDKACYADHDVGAFFQSLFWPIGLPWRLGVTLAGRDQVRRARELADAKHRVELAQLAEREAAAVDRAYHIAKREAT